jgi:hypothetical protein
MGIDGNIDRVSLKLDIEEGIEGRYDDYNDNNNDEYLNNNYNDNYDNDSSDNKDDNNENNDNDDMDYIRIKSFLNTLELLKTEKKSRPYK